MKKIKFTIALFLLIFGGGQIFAQFTLSGEFRPRTEYSHGYKKLAVKDQKFALATNQRTRLNFDYKTGAYQVFVSFQDVRLWGSENQLVNNDGAHSTLHQAWANIHFNNVLSLKAGRQEIVYDDHRIFGSVGWAPQARSHDAAIFKYSANGFKTDLGFAFNLYDDSAVKNPKAFQYLWVHKSFGNLSASFLALNNGVKGVDDKGEESINYSQTIGTRAGYKAGKFSAFLNLYYQGGKTKTNAKINANLIGLDLGYKVSKAISLGLGFEQQSGNDMKDPNKEQNAFAPLYGTNHKFNGHMDYFYVGNHGGSVGLRDMFLKLGYKKNKLGLGAHLHYFMAANNMANSLDAALGTELDLSLSYPLAKGVGFKVGYSQMFGTDSMVALRGGGVKDEISNWAWMMIVIKPKFFTTAKK